MKRFGIFRTIANEHYLIDMNDGSVKAMEYVCRNSGFMKQIAEFNAVNYEAAIPILSFIRGG